jgi:hypothetical protein
LDLTFDVGDGPFGNVWSLAAMPGSTGEESILVGGDFLLFDNVFRRGVARLLADGSVDNSFDPGNGLDGPVLSMGVQADGAILLAGGFKEYDARRRIGVVRVLSDGTLDTTIDPGNGPNDLVFTVAIQSDQKAIIGGRFTDYNGTRRLGLARLRRDGALDTSFMDTAYNQFAGLINPFSFQPPNFLNSIAIQPDGDIMIGGSFKTIGGNPSFTTPVRVVNTYVPEDNSVVFTRAARSSERAMRPLDSSPFLGRAARSCPSCALGARLPRAGTRPDHSPREVLPCTPSSETRTARPSCEPATSSSAT